jgi:ParB-like chromosome segregation protein Spo0J
MTKRPRSKKRPLTARPSVRPIAIAKIVVGERHRREMGDIAGLAASMAELTLFQAIGVTPGGKLIWGERRLRAAQRLGWTEIAAHVVDLDDIVRGEYAENAVRKDFTLSEAVAIKRSLEPLEKAAAKERQKEAGERGKEGGRGKKNPLGKLPQGFQTAPPTRSPRLPA